MELCERKRCKNNNEGFTLVELIIVIAIIAILAGAVGLSVIRYIEETREQMDVHNACLIRDALRPHAFPSDYKGENVNYTDPVTHETETYQRGWVYVDHSEIRCSDSSTAMALIDAGLVEISHEAEVKIRLAEINQTTYFPTAPDGDYIRKSNINEYVFHNNLCCKAKRNWNTYQLDVYIAGSGEPVMGASASNTNRTSGHEKDEETAKMFAEKLGYDGARITPIGEQYRP